MNIECAACGNKIKIHEDYFDYYWMDWVEYVHVSCTFPPKEDE